MTQSMVRLAPGELALWLGLPIEDMRATIRSRAQEGRWRIISGDASPGTERVELPAADLNAELDARHGDGRQEPAEAPPQDSQLTRLETELARARLRNDELNRLLLQASHALEEARSRRSEPAPQPEHPRTATPSDELIEAKRALIDAYDKILDLQKQVYASGEEVAAAREDSAAVDTIHSILDRVKARRKDS